MSRYVMIAVGGALGAIARYQLAAVIQARVPVGFPYGTFVVNVSGCLIMGFVTALLLYVFYRGARALGAARRAALFAALMLGFATPVWVYAKSFLAEPFESLGLLLALTGASLAGSPRGPRSAAGSWEALAGWGALIAVSVKLSMLPLVLGALSPLIADVMAA